MMIESHSTLITHKTFNLPTGDRSCKSMLSYAGQLFNTCEHTKAICPSKKIYQIMTIAYKSHFSMSFRRQMCKGLICLQNSLHWHVPALTYFCPLLGLLVHGEEDTQH